MINLRLIQWEGEGGKSLKDECQLCTIQKGSSDLALEKYNAKR